LRFILLLVVFLAAGPAFARAQSEADEAKAIFARALELQQAEDLAAAAAEYERFLTLHPGSIVARSNLGVVLVRLGRYEDAIAHYRRAVALDGDNVQVRLNLALAFYKAALFSDAVDQLAAVLARQPGHLQATLLKADCHLTLGEPAKTIELLRPLGPAPPHDRAIAYLLGMAYAETRQLDDAKLQLDRILRDGDSAEAHLMLGLALRAGNDFPGAREEFRKAVELNGTLPLAHSLYGQTLLATGDRDAARREFDLELRQNPNEFESNLSLGMLLREEGSYAEALPLLDRALHVRPGHAAARYQIAALHLAARRLDQARELLETLVRDEPKFTEAHVSLATVYYRLNRTADADRHRAIVAELTREAQAKQALPRP
jgi:tetratricopeptide (TPR) repeat protein